MPKSPSLGERLTAKAGPLPVWAWAALLLGAFLAYQHFHSSASSTTNAGAGTTGGTDNADTTGAAPSDLTPISPDSGLPVGSSGQGGAADNINDTLLSQLSGFQASIDSLTAAVQSQDAFYGWPPDTTGAHSMPFQTLQAAVPTPAPAKKTAAVPAKPSAAPDGALHRG
jgi:hypothetical protein